MCGLDVVCVVELNLNTSSYYSSEVCVCPGLSKWEMTERGGTEGVGQQDLE